MVSKGPVSTEHVCCNRVLLFKWMSSWKPSGDAHFLIVSGCWPILDQISLFVVMLVVVNCRWLEVLLRWFFPGPAAVDAAVELITGRPMDAAGEGNGPMENHAVAKSLKRPNADSDEEDDKGAVAPPVHDIYRSRQQKRIR